MHLSTLGGPEIFLLAMMIIFTPPYLVWRLCRTDHWAPLVVVQILGGIVLGPGILGALLPGYYTSVFTPSTTTALNGLAQWSVMLFVWAAGLELDVRAAWAKRVDTGVTAALALSAPLVLGAFAAGVTMTGSVWRGPHGAPWRVVLGIGMACAVTAIPILVLLLEKLDILRTPLGRRAMRYGSLDDVAIWAVLALIIADWERVGRQLVFLVASPVAALVLRRLMVRLPVRDRWHVALVWLVLCGFAADWSGLHFMVGAFVAGVVMDVEWFGAEAVDRFRETVLLAFMPVFFLSTGLRTRWDAGGVAVFGAAAMLLVASVVGKIGGVHIAGRLLRWRKGESAVLGWLLQAKGLIVIVFANILLDKGVISGAAFTAVLLMAVGSTMLTIPAVTWLRKRDVAPPLN